MKNDRKKRATTTASLRHERHYFNEGCTYIVGMDEAGRGPLAGPVAVGAVCLPLDQANLTAVLKGVRDSKQMTALQRESFVERIKATAVAWGIGHASAAEISDVGINPATKIAMQRALDAALQDKAFTPDCLFLDYFLWPERRDIPQVSIVSGDQHSLSIAAASVLAKTWRDAYMFDRADDYPQYDFASNKGYGSAVHLAALERYGPCPEHRTNYAPVRALLEDGG